MGSVFTDQALALMAAADVSGDHTHATAVGVRIGTLAAGDRYDATADRTALVDPTPMVFDMQAIDLVGSGPRVNYHVVIALLAALTGSEVGFYNAAGILLLLWADQADDVFVKAADTNALITVVYEYTNGVPTGLTVTQSASPIATPGAGGRPTSRTRWTPCCPPRWAAGAGGTR